MPNRLWALIEAEDGGLYRSDDAGDTWQKLTGESNLWWRAPYYIHVFAHPQRPGGLLRPIRTSSGSPPTVAAPSTGQPMPHGDNHDLWIDPNNPDRMIEGSDGGAVVSSQRWAFLVHPLQSAHRQLLPPHHRHPTPLPRLRHSDGQHRHERSQQHQ